MKYLIEKTTWRLPVVVVALFMVFFSCEDDKKKGGDRHDPNSPVKLFSFQPDSGRIRDQFLVNGKNFGSDPSQVRVFFNGMDEALVVGCVDEQILALVPRTVDGFVEVSVQVGNNNPMFLSKQFLYKSSRQVVTVAGTGENTNDFDHGILDRAKIVPVYIGIDQEQNIFVTANNGRFVLINEEENKIVTLLTEEQGFTHRCPPVIHPVNNWVLLGHETVRDRFLMLDPQSNWAPTLCFIRNWDTGPVDFWDGADQPKRAKFSIPTGSDIHHYSLLYCEYDSCFYTRYGRANNNGQIVKIDPNTWNAEIIGMTPPGASYGMAFNTWRDPDDPDNRDKSKTWELWIAYAGDDGGTEECMHNICTVDIRDRQTWKEVNGAGSHPWWREGRTFLDNIMSSFERKTYGGSGHRDGLLEQSQFNGPRQISFDKTGILYVGDNNNHCIRKIDTRRGIVSNYIGIPRVSSPFADGNEQDATFRNVHGIVTIETANDYLIYASDYGNNRIRRVSEE